MNPLLSANSIHLGNSVYKRLNSYISEQNYSKVFLLVDNNSQQYCLTRFDKNIDFQVEVIKINSGEQFKTLDTCQIIWSELSEKGADRKSILINLGGGVITDIGGFVASCFRRGISFLHIPTTLLGMVDAAIGGKTGVDLMHLKNQIGVINQPDMVLYDFRFLSTLPKIELVSGFAEILKHGLIVSKNYLDKCFTVNDISYETVIPLIQESIETKLKIVLEDTNENGIRKALNYGHTLGHAIETYRMEQESSQHLLHGEAIAIGLVLETFISKELYGFPEEDLEKLKNFIDSTYVKQDFSNKDQNEIINIMKYDKKNIGDNVNFVLLKEIGKPVLDCKVDNDLIFTAFEYYQS